MAENEMAENEWTVMFLFAGDNALSPLIVSQLKDIKDAGFQENTDVLVHFDPNEIGAPTRIFHVNRKRKKHDPRRPTMIGDGADSFVRNMKDDSVDPKEIQEAAGAASARIKEALQSPDKVTAVDALRNFLGFCRENHRAKNYMLFLLGHGLIVGNDAFLPDERPVSAITLSHLEEILRGFATDIENDNGGILQLLALNSCSMSAIEVAYQLKGTAKFMIGSEGISYVGSWPYRQLLKNLFNNVERAKRNGSRKGQTEDSGQEQGFVDPYYKADDPYDLDIRRLVEKLYFLSLFNATDYMLSGYSLDLCLCSLEPEKFQPLTEAIQLLVAKLKDALRNNRGQELILLAHWESQSYWDESFTDLFDFCRCLRKRCLLLQDLLGDYGDKDKIGEVGDELKGLLTACEGVMEKLEQSRSDEFPERFKQIIIHSDHFGPKYQYSHGLSIYFPWSQPVEDDPTPNLSTRLQAQQNKPEAEPEGIIERYRDYKFSKELGDDSWINFLVEYFKETQRKTRLKEDGQSGRDNEAGEFTNIEFFNSFGEQSDNPLPALIGKPTPSTGADCGCPSIKNYPAKVITIRGKDRYVKTVTISEGAAQAFK
jgi:hypothetical protein